MPPPEGEIKEELDEELDAELDPSLSDDDPGEDDKPEESEEEITVAIGDEEPAPEDSEPAPGWVKELRKNHRQTQKENRELKRKLDAKDEADSNQDALGEKPTLIGCDYDSDKYDKDLSVWYERKRENEQKQEKDSSEKKAQAQEWQATLDSYKEKKSKLKVTDFEDSEAFVEETLSITQQGMILSAADDPALLIYAIGKNQKRAKELAAIKDPVKFAFAVAKLETQLKVSPRKASTKPEKQLSGTGPVSGTTDATLNRLRAKAEKTGDYSAVTQYNRDKKRKVS